MDRERQELFIGSAPQRRQTYAVRYNQSPIESALLRVIGSERNGRRQVHADLCRVITYTIIQQRLPKVTAERACLEEQQPYNYISGLVMHFTV
jgi:hypothetical protein